MYAFAFSFDQGPLRQYSLAETTSKAFERDLPKTIVRSKGVYVGRLGRAAICVIVSLIKSYECGLARSGWRFWRLALKYASRDEAQYSNIYIYVAKK